MKRCAKNSSQSSLGEASVTVSSSFCATHRLPLHYGLCRFLHGHDFQIELSFKKLPIDVETGLAMDFSVINILIEDNIKDTFDHAVLVWDKDKELLEFCTKNSQRFVAFRTQPTAEAIGNYIWNLIVGLMKTNNFTIKIWESPDSFVTVG